MAGTFHAFEIHGKQNGKLVQKELTEPALDEVRVKVKYVGICGQGPSDHPDFAHWLADEGINSISLNPDSVIETWKMLAK